jgi:hypothetical protein
MRIEEKYCLERIKKRKKKREVSPQLQQDKETTWSNVCYETLEEDKSWARRGLVGIVNRPNEVPLLQQKILNVEITPVKICSMGGKSAHLPVRG